MPKMNGEDRDLHHIIESVKSELTYYANRYRNDGTNGRLLPGTDSAIQRAIVLICCMENHLYEYNDDFSVNMNAPISASRLPGVKMDLAGLSRYARDKGVAVRELSEEEKTDSAYSRRNDLLGILNMENGLVR